MNTYIHVRNACDRVPDLVSCIDFTEATVIYVVYKTNIDQLSEELNQIRVHHAVYYSELSNQEKAANLKAFYDDEIRLIIATSALGMGFDKANVRHVIHYGYPNSIRDYYQQIGRAGRDGLQARATIFLSTMNERRRRYIQNFLSTSETAIHDCLDYVTVKCILNRANCVWQGIAAVFDDRESFIWTPDEWPLSRCCSICYVNNTLGYSALPIESCAFDLRDLLQDITSSPIKLGVSKIAHWMLGKSWKLELKGKSETYAGKMRQLFNQRQSELRERCRNRFSRRSSTHQHYCRSTTKRYYANNRSEQQSQPQFEANEAETTTAADDDDDDSVAEPLCYLERSLNYWKNLTDYEIAMKLVTLQADTLNMGRDNNIADSKNNESDSLSVTAVSSVRAVNHTVANKNRDKDTPVDISDGNNHRHLNSAANGDGRNRSNNRIHQDNTNIEEKRRKRPSKRILITVQATEKGISFLTNAIAGGAVAVAAGLHEYPFVYWRHPEVRERNCVDIDSETSYYHQLPHFRYEWPVSKSFMNDQRYSSLIPARRQQQPTESTHANSLTSNPLWYRTKESRIRVAECKYSQLILE